MTVARFWTIADSEIRITPPNNGGGNNGGGNGGDKPGRGGGRGPTRPGGGGGGGGKPGGGGGGAVTYDNILAAEIGNGTGSAAERSLPSGTTNITLTSSDLQGVAADGTLFLQFGFNDGVSTTWYDGASDYTANSETDAVQASAAASACRLFRDRPNDAFLTRPHAWSFSADCLHLAVPTTTIGSEFLGDSGGSSLDGSWLTHLMQDAVVVNRFRVWFDATSGASGSIRVKYETRPVVLVESTDVSAIGNTHDVDLTGYSSVRLVSTDMVISAATGGLEVRLSSDGSTFPATSGDYGWAQETGSSSTNANSTGLVPDGTASATKAFTMEIFNLDVAVNSFSHATSMNAAASQPRFWSRTQTTPAVHTHARLKLPGATTGVSGTLYWIADSSASTIIASRALSAYTDPGTLAANPDPVVSDDVSAYGRITMICQGGAVAAAAYPVIRISDDSAVTFETAGYAFKMEDGSIDNQRAEDQFYQIGTASGGTGTGQSFFMYAENVNLLAPMMGGGVYFDAVAKAFAMVKANTPVTDAGLMFVNTASTDHVAGSTGTVYLVGRE